jgi:hypothetical protein
MRAESVRKAEGDSPDAISSSANIQRHNPARARALTAPAFFLEDRGIPPTEPSKLWRPVGGLRTLDFEKKRPRTSLNVLYPCSPPLTFSKPYD